MSQRPYGKGHGSRWLSLLGLVATVLLATVLIAPAEGVGGISEPRFLMPDESPAPGSYPADVILGDFTGDGRTDAAVANDGPASQWDGGISTLPGNGQGKLGDPIVTILPSDWGAAELVSADFDEDGALDLVAVASPTIDLGRLLVLLGNGDGTFTLHRQFADTKETHLAAADFDGDGHADFAASSPTRADIDIWFGDGAGGFPRIQDLDSPSSTWEFIGADMEGDGDTDLFGATGGSPFSMMNRGDGTFAPARFSDGLFGIAFTMGKFDADGLLDMAMGGASEGTAAIGLGNPDGTFTEIGTYPDLAQDVDSLTSGDVTGDGRTDLLVNADQPSTNLLPGRGDGTFGPPTMFVTGSQDLVAADMNGDPWDDLLALVPEPGRVYLTLGAGRRGFRAPHGTESANQPEQGFFSEHMNGDALPDVIMIGSILPEPGLTVSQASVFLNLGQARFSQPVVTRLDSGPDNTSIGAFVMGDVNVDGSSDLVGVFVRFSPFAKNLITWLGTGDGGFERPMVASPQIEPNDVEYPLTIADVTEDGAPDVIAPGPGAISVLRGNGDGTFDAPSHTGFSTCCQAEAQVADFTGDGHMDLLVPIVTGNQNSSSSDVYLEQGNGDGTFLVIQKQTIDTNINAGVAAALNEDGRPDAALIGSGGNDVGRAGLWVFLNQGGVLGNGVIYFRGSGGLSAGDVNLDGAVDLMSDDITISLNDGTGRFDQFLQILAAGAAVYTDDFTSDGRPDFLTGIGSARHGFTIVVNLTSQPRRG